MEILMWIVIAVALMAVVSLVVAVLTSQRPAATQGEHRPAAEADPETVSETSEDDLLEDEATG